MRPMTNLSLVMGAAGTLLVGGWLGCSSSNGAGTPTGDAGSDDSAMGSDSAGDGAAGDSGGEGSPQLPISCENYCSLVMSNCTGQSAEYSSKEICLGMCGHMTLGADPDMTGDTVACRQAHAGAAQGNPSVTCPLAGPTGGDTCGSSHCAAWCALDIAQCGTIAFADQAACATACAMFAYTPSAGDIAHTTMNTMNCRIYHLEAAYANDGGLSSVHCPHTGVQSSVCIP